MTGASVARKKKVTVEEAAQEVEVAITRLALLHLAFSKTLVNEFGSEKGKELIVKSILEYGKRIGERIKNGLPDLPKYGVYSDYRDDRVFGCVLARTFHEYGENELGCLYCYVDAAKSMAVDSERKFIHKDCAACGDDYCTFEQLPTTQKERTDFEKMRASWVEVDPRLAKGCTSRKTRKVRA
jgi:hypothetical protein